jgi:hypothetical protein
VGIDAPSLGVGADHPDGLLRVVDGVGLRVVPVHAHPVPENNGRHPVLIEIRDEVRPLGADIQGVVPPPAIDDHGRAGVCPAVHAMQLDGRVVNIDDALDTSGTPLAMLFFSASLMRAWLRNGERGGYRRKTLSP